MILHLVIASITFGQILSVRTPTVEFVDGRQIPVIGLGTFESTDNQTVMDRIISDAIDVGYRHIDTAYFYQNEALIGNALKPLIDNKIVNRSDLFITSKVWRTFMKRSQVVRSIQLSLNNLKLDYLDLALVHWPITYKSGSGYLWPVGKNNQSYDEDTDIVETWQGMEDAYRLGLAKSIGVSNFNSQQLTRIMKNTFLKPVVNQIEVHAYMSQENLTNFCRENGIQVTAYCPLGNGFQNGLFQEPDLVAIAAKYQKSVPQVLLRWLIQRDIIAIPKTTRKERMSENINIFDFQLNDEEMAKIFALNKNMRHIDPKVSANNPNYPFRIPY